jgi:hypothetical protein
MQSNFSLNSLQTFLETFLTFVIETISEAATDELGNGVIDEDSMGEGVIEGEGEGFGVESSLVDDGVEVGNGENVE